MLSNRQINNEKERYILVNLLDFHLYIFFITKNFNVAEFSIMIRAGWNAA